MSRVRYGMLALGVAALLMGCEPSEDAPKASASADPAKSAEPLKKPEKTAKIDKADKGSGDEATDDAPIEADFEEDAEEDIDETNYDDALADLEEDVGEE